jgi:hypothetical protein
MNRTAVFTAAGQLASWVESLHLCTASSLEQCEDLLSRRPDPNDPIPADGLMGLVLRAIEERIEEVMAAYDRLLAAADRPPYFKLPLQLMEAPRMKQWRVPQFLDAPCPGPAARSAHHPRPSARTTPPPQAHGLHPVGRPGPSRPEPPQPRSTA